MILWQMPTKFDRETVCVCVATAGMARLVASRCLKMISLFKPEQFMTTSDKHLSTHLITMF